MQCYVMFIYLVDRGKVARSCVVLEFPAPRIGGDAPYKKKESFQTIEQRTINERRARQHNLVTAAACLHTTPDVVVELHYVS